MNKEEKEYLDIVHKVHREHNIQTKLFSIKPIAVCFEHFLGICQYCSKKLQSRPLYIVKFPTLDTYQVKYWCPYCAGLHEKYIISLIITKN